MNKKLYSYGDFIVHEIEGYIGNIHLIEYEQGLLMIDSGCINDIKRIREYCHNIIKRPLTDVKLIIVSHLHPDHAGGAVRLRAKYNIPSAAHKNIDKWYSGLGGMLQHKVDSYLATVVAFRNKRKLERILYERKIRPDYLLVDEDVLPFFSDWQVLHTPGHTLCDIVIYHPAEQLLFINDLICDVKGQPQLPIPVLFPGKMAKSFERLSTFDVETMFRTHGQPIMINGTKEIFSLMLKILNQPWNRLTRRIYHISVFPAVARKELKAKSKKALPKDRTF